MNNLPAAWQEGKCQVDAVSLEMQLGANAAASLGAKVGGDSEFVPQADPATRVVTERREVRGGLWTCWVVELMLHDFRLP